MNEPKKHESVSQKFRKWLEKQLAPPIVHELDKRFVEIEEQLEQLAQSGGEPGEQGEQGETGEAGEAGGEGAEGKEGEAGQPAEATVGENGEATVINNYEVAESGEAKQPAKEAKLPIEGACGKLFCEEEKLVFENKKGEKRTLAEPIENREGKTSNGSAYITKKWVAMTEQVGKWTGSAAFPYGNPLLAPGKNNLFDVSCVVAFGKETNEATFTTTGTLELVLVDVNKKIVVQTLSTAAVSFERLNVTEHGETPDSFFAVSATNLRLGPEASYKEGYYAVGVVISGPVTEVNAKYCITGKGTYKVTQKV